MSESGWLRAFHLLFYGCLGLAATVSVLRLGPDPVTVGALAVIAAWYGWFVARRPGLLERLHPMGWHLLVLLGLLFVLISRDPLFEIMVFGMVALPYVMLPYRWGHVGAVLLVLVAAQASGRIEEAVRQPVVLAVLAGNFALVIVMGTFVQALVKHGEQARTVGTLEERARLAREIHDTLAQGFSGIITQLEAAEQAGAEPEAVRARIAVAKRLARESLNEARRSVEALRPEPLEHAELPEALSAVAERWSDGIGVPVSVAVDGEPRRLPREVETTVLRAAQEALANVAKHAKAGRAALTLSYMDDQVTLDVLDDGAGFDPGAAAGGYGLVAMRERAERSGGTVIVESTPGEGTALCLSIPCA
ncbi:sensor histidine kinase [Nonomuraea sp. NN258]|uniref:sensor histidine kinase n=1 Tax=Nonomuraea antri TaxID=2730852 RepID=UPI0015684942|nr:sensor histidine kinase [Nonomuraea antri]NRQ31014.1 sensor histidine kinase [Nonomuraea antri]